MTNIIERTFVMINPDGIQRSLIGNIIAQLEIKQLKPVALKFIWPSEDQLRAHYAEHSDKPFFSTLIQSTSSGPVVIMVWEGLNAVKIGRSLLGATDPKDSHPGTFRGDLSIQVGCKNVIHGSDSVQSANKEINLWFEPNELMDWKSSYEKWIYTD